MKMNIKLAIVTAAIILGAQSMSASTTSALTKATKKLIIENQTMSAQIKENTKNTLENKVSLEEIKEFYRASQADGEGKAARDNRDVAINKLTKSEGDIKDKNNEQDSKLEAIKSQNLTMNLDIKSLKDDNKRKEAAIDSLKDEVKTIQYNMKNMTKSYVSVTPEPAPVVAPAAHNVVQDTARMDSLEKQFREFKLAQEKENADKSLRIASLNTAVQEATAENKRLKETVDRYKSQIGGYKSEVQKQLKDIEDKTSISKLKIIEKQSLTTECSSKSEKCSEDKGSADRKVTEDEAVILDFINK